MQKTLMAYFSQGGTTKKVADKIAHGLQSRQFLVDFHNIAVDPPVSIAGYDMIGIGSPVYIFRPPFNVLDFIKGLPVLNGLPYFVFLLYGTEAGTAGNIIRKTLSRKGGREIGYKKYKGRDFFLGYLQRGYLFSPNNPSEDELKEAEEFGKDLSNRISGGDYVEPGMDKMPPVVYSLERLITTRSQVKQIYSRFFKVDKKNCTSCEICAQNCPKNNIRFDENDLPTWGRDCVACFYCQMNCPLDAVTSPMDWAIMAPFINYNINRVKKDRKVEHVRVVHKEGKTVRIWDRENSRTFNRLKDH